jgi:phosphomannomutase
MRGTIGGSPGTSLTPIDLVEFVTAYVDWLKRDGHPLKVVVGRDGRITGPPVQNIVMATLQLCGCSVIDLGLSTTPTVEMAVPYHKAGGGIILTASHNPEQWNALKFLNYKGEFISEDAGKFILARIEEQDFEYPDHTEMGSISLDENAIDRHIQSICDLPYVDVEAIRNAKFKAVIDPVNSTGAISIPPLLEALGVGYEMINGEVTGKFAHNPEPLPKHLEELSKRVVGSKADLGISVDPDVDRLVLVSEDGSFFGEEYTLVAAADLVLSTKPGPTVSNLSSSRALSDLSRSYGVSHYQSAVGEVHVVKMMKEVKATIGGEGNGGVILPDLHYGRDALAGIALILSLMVKESRSLSDIRSSYSHYTMVKDKISITGQNPDEVLAKVGAALRSEGITFNTTDGLKIDRDEGWVHLRKSNTEPIIRLYIEASNEEGCAQLKEWIKHKM